MIKSEIEIDIEKPFLNDKLDREKIADVLTKIIDGNSGNFVLSVESRWGTGKTTFFKMWKQKLDNTDKYKTIYFNAWENDDSEDPLLAILSEMESIFEKSKYDKIKKSIVPLLKQAFPVAIKIYPPLWQ